MCRSAIAVLIAAFMFVASPPPRSVAGIAESPLPVLQAGVSTQFLCSVPGVRNDGGSNLGTFFVCTSTSTSPQVVSVEVFADTGGGPTNNASTNAQTVAPGGTVRFGTASAGSLFQSGFANQGNLALGAFIGSARILSTSKSLICTAFVADVGNATPESGSQLTIVKKAKQKAAN